MWKRQAQLSMMVVFFGLVIATALIASSLIDEPLRRYAERQANASLPGYRISIGGLALHPLSLSIDLHDVIVRQAANPDPPLASIPRLTVDAQLAPLLTGSLAADFRIDRPSVSLTQELVREAVSMAGAWQDRILNLYPFSIERGAIEDGDVIYRHSSSADPLRIEHLTMSAGNIRNVESPPEEYPSDLHLHAQLPDKAKLELKGKADLFARPLPTVDAKLKIQDLRLTGLKPILEEYNVRIREGLLDMACGIKQERKQTVVAVESFLLEHAKIDYIHNADTNETETRRLKESIKRAKQATQNPSLVLRVGHGKILNSEMGFVNRSTSPDYRVFLADMNVDVDHFSNRLEEGTGVVKVTGKFMGSGPTLVIGTFRPEKPNPDFNLEVKIIKTRVKALNDVLRAYGNIEVRGGMFAFFSELSVKDNHIDGYVKPLLRDVDVYDPEKDKDKPLARKVYKAVVDGVMGLLESKAQKEVATETNLSGEVQNLQAGTWQIIGNLVRNAFFKAILPGFEGRA